MPQPSPVPSARHWGIENRLHWVLDVVFKDDLSRLRTGHAPENMAVVRHMALNLVRDAPGKHSLKVRRKIAAWSNDYLEPSCAAPPEQVHAIALADYRPLQAAVRKSFGVSNRRLKITSDYRIAKVTR